MIVHRSVVVVLVACGGGGKAIETTSEPETASPREELNEVQLECRSSQITNIGMADRVFGPGCNRPTMPLSLRTFDNGAFNGFVVAERTASVFAIGCICKAMECNESNRNRAIADLENLSEAEAKSERDAVYSVTSSLAGSDCLDTAIGVNLFKLGYKCGYATALRSRILRQKMEDDILQIFKDDKATGETVARSCWSEVSEQ